MAKSPPKLGRTGVKHTPQKPPGYLPSKKPPRRRPPVDIDPVREHLGLKNYLQTRRLVVERSLNPAVRAELPALERYITYLRSIE